jgi:signal transduction histidine kinase
MRILKRGLYIQSGEPATYLRKLPKLRHLVAFRLTIWYTGFIAISLLGALAAFYFIPLHGFQGASQYLLEELREEFRRYFGVPVAILIVLSAGVGWFMAKRALSGVEEVTRAAVDITRGALDRRVPVTLNGDEIDRLANAFNTMVDRVQELIGQMKEITENIAHDLRSPITRMRGLAEMALTGDNTNHNDPIVTGTIIEECDRLLEMINAMLDISEAESGLMKLKVEPVDIAVLLHDVSDLFQPVAENRGINMALDTPQSITVFGESKKLQRVFSNLIDNALKYTLPGGSVHISISEITNNVVVTIRDSGLGIAAEDLPHIFDRFFRGEKSRSTQGNGLGLSLAQAFVLVHGGTITATSTPGQGSQFVITLPQIALPSPQYDHSQI